MDCPDPLPCRCDRSKEQSHELISLRWQLGKLSRKNSFLFIHYTGDSHYRCEFHEKSFAYSCPGPGELFLPDDGIGVCQLDEVSFLAGGRAGGLFLLRTI